MSRLMAVIGLAVVMAAATGAAGWWMVPVLGALWGVRRSPLDADVAAGLGWGGVLAWQASRGSVGVLAEQVGGVLSLPAAALPVLTVAFAGLLAWSAAMVTAALLQGGRRGAAEDLAIMASTRRRPGPRTAT